MRLQDVCFLASGVGGNAEASRPHGHLERLASHIYKQRTGDKDTIRFEFWYFPGWFILGLGRFSKPLL
jgi:hypothetical protein